MKIAIISDVHNNETNLKKVLDYCAQNEIEKIICCGDLASMETLDFLNDNFQGEIFFTFGNMDNDFLQNYPFKNNQHKNTKIFKEFGEAEFDNKEVAFIHFPEIAEKLCKSGKYNFVFYGHTHKPFVSSVGTAANQEKKKCEMLNPGNVAGEIFLPTFAVWDTQNDKFELIMIHNIK